MKGQSEIIVFVLLFLIGVILFVSAVAWSSGIFEKNADMLRVTASEKLIQDLDNSIKDVIKFGGSKIIDYTIDGTIELVDEKTIEMKVPASIELPDYWINITSGSSYIRERLDGNLLRIQLIYENIELYTEGPRLSKPDSIKIEKDLGGRIRITFQ
jgi:hypothetical protein